jgi:IS5 family transposase
MDASGQLSFIDAELARKGKVTRRERFLAQLDRLLPWSDLLALIEPHYPKSGQRGQQPLPLVSLLRIHIAQIAYNYSDPGMEDALYEIASLRQFCRVEVDRIPDESAILRFRHLLEHKALAPVLFNTINQHLTEQKLFLKQGTIIDASLIAAPSSTKNALGERDPDMHQSKKGQQWYFGAKVHIGVDETTGLIHTLTLTPGHVADVTEAHRLLHGEETAVLGDSGYQGLDKRPEMADQPVVTVAMMRPGKLKGLVSHGGAQAQLLAQVQRELARRRAKVEHVFRDFKIRFAYAKVRYRGLAKNLNRFLCLAALSNVLRGEAYMRRKGMIAP